MLLCDNCDCGTLSILFLLTASHQPCVPFRISYVLLRTPAFDCAAWAMVLPDLHIRNWGGLWFRRGEEHSSKGDPTANMFGDVYVTEYDVEREFWRLVQSPHETVEIEYGADVHSTTHGR